MSKLKTRDQILVDACEDLLLERQTKASCDAIAHAAGTIRNHSLISSEYAYFYDWANGVDSFPDWTTFNGEFISLEEKQSRRVLAVLFFKHIGLKGLGLK